jgi:hypothetical protein
VPAPIRITCYSKAFAALFVLGDPQSLTVTVRHLDKGTATIVLPIEHHRVPALMAPGVRCVIEYWTGRPGDSWTDPANWLTLLTGPVWRREAQGPISDGLVTFTVEDDYRVLSQILGWPVPGNAINNQTSVHDVRTGPAETVIKGYVSANASRLALPLTTATNLARGTSVEGRVRFDHLADVLPPLARLGGLGVTVRQVGFGLVLDVYQPVDRSARVLSESAGTILDWAFVTVGPTGTRAVIGGQGDGASRTFRAVTKPSAETLWGTKAEIFVDSSGTTTSTELDQAGNAALADAAPAAGIAVTAAETDVVRYGRTYQVGDLVAVQITPTLLVTDVLQAATLTWSAEQGVSVEPQVGDSSLTESPDAAFAKILGRALAGIRSLRAGR